MSVLGQMESSVELFNQELSNCKSAICQDKNLKKVHQFLQEENDDSIAVYAHHFLESVKQTDDYTYFLRYFRGKSLYRKKLFQEAQREFKLIPKEFVLHTSAKMKLGEVNLELGEYRKALKYFEEIEGLPNHELRFISKSALLHNIGVCHLHLSDFNQSEEYLLKSIALQEREGDTSHLITGYMDIANLYYEQYKDDLAIPFFEKAYRLSKQYDDLVQKETAAFNMAAVEENRKDFKKALVYRKEYEQWRDSLNDQNKVWELAQLEKKFITEQKEEEIKSLEKDNEIKDAQRNTFIYSSLLLLILAGTLFYFYRSKQKVNKVILEQKGELDILNDTKDRLFSIVSHDLRSSVNALRHGNERLERLYNKEAYEQMKEQLEKNNAIGNSTHGLLDNMLNWALLQTEQLYFQPEELSLSAIVKQVTLNYEPLMEVNDIILKTTIPSDLFVFADLESLKIVLRNILDNAIKFTSPNDRILISADRIDQGYCELTVQDTGRGMSEEVRQDLLAQVKLKNTETRKERTGLGLHLCYSMMKKNLGELNIESKENLGTTIRLTIPVKNHHEQD